MIQTNHFIQKMNLRLKWNRNPVRKRTCWIRIINYFYEVLVLCYRVEMPLYVNFLSPWHFIRIHLSDVISYSNETMVAILENFLQ